MSNKHQAGYYSKNVNKDAFDYLRHVLNERVSDESHDQDNKSDIIKKINDIDKIEGGGKNDGDGKA